MRFVSQYHADKRKLEAEIRAIENAYAPSLKGKTGDEYEAEVAAMMGETEWARIALDDLETSHIEKLASKWGVEIDPSLYSDRFVGLTRRHSILDHISRPKVLRLIKVARRESVKYWVGIAAQIIGMVTGLIGVTIGLLALLKKH